MSSKHRTVVKVGGKEYTMVGTETEAYMKRVADYVDRTQNEIRIATGLIEPKLTVLTALNLADELFKAQGEVNRVRRELNLLRRQTGMLRRSVAQQAESKQAAEAEKEKNPAGEP